MSDDAGIDTPDEIAGIGDARAVLGIDRDADDDAIDAAFERLADDADGDRYWTAVAAREVARLGSVRNGLVIADVLRRQPTPADLTSLADAASLLSYSPPPSESRRRSSYNRGLSRTLETITDRLATLAAGAEFDVPEGPFERSRSRPMPFGSETSRPESGGCSGRKPGRRRQPAASRPPNPTRCRIETRSSTVGRTASPRTARPSTTPRQTATRSSDC